MGESWTVNSEQSKAAYKAQVDRDFAEHKYLTYNPPRIGVDRSLDQSALFHVWLTEFIAFKLGKHPKTVEENELEGIKRTMKKLYVIAYPDSRAWMVHEITDYSTGKKKSDYTSSASWKVGEMFLVLKWIQLFAADLGLILESKGEFAKNQRKENS